MSTDSAPLRQLGSTYRLQLNGLGFTAAGRVVPFLHELGVETLYVSPITRARSGSAHGYDVVDPTVLDPELGSRADLDGLLESLEAHGMRLLVDIVPNHMAASVENPMFADVLRYGRGSRYAQVFDIAWEAADNKVVLPVLDGNVVDVMDAGQLRLTRPKAGSGYLLAYGDLQLPVDPAGDEDIAADLADARDVKEPPARRQLELVLSHQHYRLVDWQSAGNTVNYRRFFDINDLIGLRQEDPEVFAVTHQLIIELAADPRVAGVRVDHVDGLRDPAAYLAMLRDALDGVTTGGMDRPVILVEKILERDEQLPGWPVEGTTGYEFAMLVTGLFIDEAGAARATQALAAATSDERSFRTRATEAKDHAIASLFPARLGYVSSRMTRAVASASSTRPNSADVAAAVQALTSNLAVYRTYRCIDQPVTASDHRRLGEAAAAARDKLAEREVAALDSVLAVLRGPTDLAGSGWDAIGAWQQFTPAVVAKGVEDTALYTPGTLLAVADVGGHPDDPAVAPSQLHEALSDRARHSSLGLSTLSTHDSKRSHDVRCRLAVLSESPQDWEAAVADLEVRHGRSGPDAADRRYAYETIVGAWPTAGDIDGTFIGRIQDHLVKAAREAKRNTSWLRPDERYEQRLRDLAEQTLREPASRSILRGVSATLDRPGVTNSLASVVLRAVAPGVPDVYQSDDLWFLALVDPDNRRPLDLEHHRAALSTLSAMGDPERATEAVRLLADWRDGRVKQAVLRAALHVRRSHPDLFARGTYRALAVHGSARDHVVAFARRDGDDAAICLVPRLTLTLAGSDAFAVGELWQDTAIDLAELASRRFVDALTGVTVTCDGGRLEVASVLSRLPVALLVSQPA
ncbi:MAG TPA: malto-oligosyltrehalose synthase [Mycobacteriales bacterium]|jgi:malto-oligosyltrehalose synthase|nr:malto-oligosyltrehalose synthase [Mycobacteriales bacterium]